MRKALALAGALAAATAVVAPAASASGRCYSPDFSGIPIVEDWPTTQQCINLPIDPELQ